MPIGIPTISLNNSKPNLINILLKNNEEHRKLSDMTTLLMIQIQTEGSILGITFPPYICFRHLCCYGNHSVNLTCPETICNQSPNLTMQHISFDEKMVTSLDDSTILRCGPTTTDSIPLNHAFTVRSPCGPWEELRE